MMLGLKHPDRFSAICTQAGSFAFGHALRPDRPERTPFMQAVAPSGGKYDLWGLAKTIANGLPMAIRFDIGVNDHLLAYNRQFHAHLDQLGIAHEYEEVDGGHQWSYVNRQLPRTLEFIWEYLAKAE